MAYINLEPYFVKTSENPYKLFRWKKVDCEIKDSRGQVFFSQKDVEVPEAWSQLAADMAASKYFRKTGVPKTKHEKSVAQMVERVVETIADFGLKQKYFKGPQQKNIFKNELTYILLSQKAFFNSPVWFNCGLYQAYKIESSAEQWAWDFKKKKVVPVFSAYKNPQVSACFIQSVDDDLKSIFNLVAQEAKLFKYGSGSGTNFSKIRSRYENLAGGGKSSGLISFLKVLDSAAGAIKSGGITRRAAKMVCVDIDHPEILDFIQWKKKEEQKAKILIQNGYDSDYEGEAYQTVAGQNANNSVRITSAFMKAVEEDKDWSLKKISTVKAKDLWTAIVDSAWTCADPGLQFHDTINAWNPCPKSGAINASNPCSEYMFIDDSACNLASLNLTQFLNEDGTFAQKDFLRTIKFVLLAQEILVDLAGYPTEKIAQNSHDFRPLGLGFAGLGAFLMRKGVAYNSDEGRDWATYICGLMHGCALITSSEVAGIKGPFTDYKKNKNEFLKVIQKHKKCVLKISSGHIPKADLDFLKMTWDIVEQMGRDNGFRNAQVTVIAPTGTIGLVMDSDTTGIEPEFSLVKHKKLSGGGEIRMASQSVHLALTNLNYTAKEIEAIEDYINTSSMMEGAPHLKPEHLPIFDCAQVNGSGKRCIAPEGHLKMMAAVQPFLSGAISKTINLPESSTHKDISEIYFKAWELGLKAVSIYRDKSKMSQPLNQLPVDCPSPQGCSI